MNDARGNGAATGRNAALLAALLGWLFDGFEMGLFPLVGPRALEDLLAGQAAVAPGAKDAWFGSIMAVFLVGAACGGVLFGWLGDRIGRVRAMSLSILTYALFTGICGLATTAPQIAAARFIASLGMGGEWALGVALVSELWPDASRPLLAGLAMAALFLTRPNTAPLVIIPVVELLAAHRRASAPEIPSVDERGPLSRFALWLRGTDWAPALRALALCALPVLVAGGLAMWMNEARFGRPTEFGHRFLMINWRGRIERWGLFSYHYLGKNLAVFFGSLPWLTAREPHVIVSRHGLALWFTTPALLLALWPKRALDFRMRAFFAAAAVVAVVDLMYQNSGWVQFGYRFATDYLVVLIALIALGGRKLRTPGFALALVFSIAVNLFGAITFDRAWQFYDDDATQERLFQPD